jgi:hypothetical protein
MCSAKALLALEQFDSLLEGYASSGSGAVAKGLVSQ